jgi:integrase
MVEAVQDEERLGPPGEPIPSPQAVRQAADSADMPISVFNKAWRSATRAAGYAGILLHDLRRSGVRAMVRAGVPEAAAQRISGHATAAVFRRHDITSDQDLKDARDRRAQFEHKSVAKVVSIAR